MTPIVDAGQAQKETEAAFLAVRALYGSEQYKIFTDWITALAAQQQVYLTTCRREQLPDAQTRLKQLLALMSAVTPKEPGSTGHLFD